MARIFSVVVLLALLMTGASTQSKPQQTQGQRDKLIRDYATIGFADTMAVIYDASCLNVNKHDRDQCYTEDMATLSAAIKSVETYMKKAVPDCRYQMMLVDC
jgi:hypothetical protein